MTHSHIGAHVKRPTEVHSRNTPNVPRACAQQVSGLHEPRCEKEARRHLSATSQCLVSSVLSLSLRCCQCDSFMSASAPPPLHASAPFTSRPLKAHHAPFAPAGTRKSLRCARWPHWRPSVRRVAHTAAASTEAYPPAGTHISLRCAGCRRDCVRRVATVAATATTPNF